VLVTAVAAGGPGAHAGLRARRDAIVALDGRPVTTSAQIAEAVARHRPGDRIALRVVRGGHTRNVTVTVGTAPAAGS
jgi:S1-C subfamily serine protease